VQALLRKHAYKVLSALVCAAAIAAAGCHNANNSSYYGIAWVDVSDQPGDYVSYIVTIDSVTLTRTDGVVITAVGTPELVDLTQVHNIAEMWSSGAIPDGAYTAATITVDYTPVASGGSSAITVMVNGRPETATVLDAATGGTPTTYAVTVGFDPYNLPEVQPTFASTSAVLLNVDFDLAASGTVDTTTSPPTVHVRPFMSMGKQSPYDKLIRVRGPLINSSVDVNTYTVYVRPFYDEANNIGSLTLFNQPNTVYTINGKTFVGAKGLDTLSVLSAGTTITAGYTTFQTDYNALNSATAGRFNLVYVVAGSTLEDEYTEGITGDVVARSGNTLTLQGSTLILTTADTFEYKEADTEVLLGAGTLVTADNNSTLTALTPDAISVGDHITARGLYNVLSDGTIELDSTGTSSDNTGSVRLQPTEIWGPLVSSAAGNLVMDVQTINGWPADVFDFTGNGAAAVTPTAFSVDTGSIPVPAGTAVGAPLWVTGYSASFGSAPPDSDAVSVNNETSVQVAGAQVGGGASTTPGTRGCGVGSQVCDPAVLQVTWAPNTTPFTDFSVAGFSISYEHAFSAVVRIGPEIINLPTLSTPIRVVPTTLTVTSTFAPRYTVGDPDTASVTATVATSTTLLQSYSGFSDWFAKVNATLTSAAPAEQLSASGIYDRATNTFTATSIDFVL
jgi:hypothetical protein